LFSSGIQTGVFLFYMSKQTDQIYAQLLPAIQKLQQIPQWHPGDNPAQDALTSNALAGNDWLQKGDYSQLPKGQFFNFQMPQEQMDEYKRLTNVNQGGTFALAANNRGSGATAATDLQNKYLQDKFARDASQNYQNNIANASNNIQGALQQSSGANLQTQGLDLQGQGLYNQTQSGGVDALNNLYKTQLNKPNLWGDVIKAGGALGAAAITKF